VHQVGDQPRLYTTMHGQPFIKICNAKQARQIYQYKKRILINVLYVNK